MIMKNDYEKRVLSNTKVKKISMQLHYDSFNTTSVTTTHRRRRRM